MDNRPIMHYAIYLLMAVVALTGCGGGGPAAEALPFQSVLDQLTRSFPEGTYVFRNQGEMAAAWNASPQEFGEAKPLPQVDFAASTVVGVSLGVGIRCDAPVITQVSRTGSAVTVSYRTNLGTGVTTLACLHRWKLTDFALIPATPEPATFRFERVPG